MGYFRQHSQVGLLLQVTFEQKHASQTFIWERAVQASITGTMPDEPSAWQCEGATRAWEAGGSVTVCSRKSEVERARRSAHLRVVSNYFDICNLGLVLSVRS